MSCTGTRRYLSGVVKRVRDMRVSGDGLRFANFSTWNPKTIRGNKNTVVNCGAVSSIVVVVTSSSCSGGRPVAAACDPGRLDVLTDNARGRRGYVGASGMISFSLYRFRRSFCPLPLPNIGFVATTRCKTEKL